MQTTEGVVRLNLVRPAGARQGSAARAAGRRKSWGGFSRLSLKALLVLGDVTVGGLVVLTHGILWSRPLQAPMGVWAAVASAAVLGMYLVEGYEPKGLRSWAGVPTRVLLGLVIGALVVGSLAFAVPPLEMTRRVAAELFLVLAPGLLAWRLAGAQVLHHALPHRRVAVVGSGDAARELIQAFGDNEAYELAMVVAAADEELLATGSEAPIIHADYAELPEILAREAVDLAAVALPARGRDPLIHALVGCRYFGIEVENVATCLELLDQRLPVRYLEDDWVAFSSRFVGWDRDFELKQKRLLDLVIAGTGLLVGLPIILAVALAIRLTSRGPVVYRQTRVGKGGGPFTLFKFRSMRADAENGAAVWADEEDPRVTMVGAFLRKTHLDELPQLWNVIRGDMSLVGPRPERPEFVKELSERIPYYDLRHVVKPGLTGWAQIQYPYGASFEDSEAKLEYDLYYVRHKDVVWDLRILLRTVTVSFLGRGSR